MKWKTLNFYSQGFRTGFAYTDPLVRKEPMRMANDVELPPTVSNLGFLMEEDELYKDSPLKVGKVSIGEKLNF